MVKKKKNTLGCLFYLALVLLVLVVFLFNRSTVQEVIKKTGFFDSFKKKKDTPPEVVITPLNPGDDSNVEPKKDSREVIVKIEDENKPAEKSEEERPQPKVRKARLFFISVTEEGKIELKGMVRSIHYQDAPLTSTLEILLKGPLPAEINQGLITLIPPGTQIRNIKVNKNTAVLDFNEAFRFNSIGKEGAVAQLKQIVYSVTEFSNIKKVRILIEGKPVDYLGPEGVFIGEPLSRNSFID